jgi:hypothetical protein
MFSIYSDIIFIMCINKKIFFHYFGSYHEELKLYSLSIGKPKHNSEQKFKYSYTDRLIHISIHIQAGLVNLIALESILLKLGISHLWTIEQSKDDQVKFMSTFNCYQHIISLQLNVIACAGQLPLAARWAAHRAKCRKLPQL